MRYGPKKTVLLCVLFWILPSWGQNTGELRGYVRDTARHPVVSAFAIITGRDTSMMRAATTDEAGEFYFPSLPVGSYDLEVKADGFAPFIFSDIRASIGQVIKLNIGLVSQDQQHESQATATVAGLSDESPVETTDAQLGLVMQAGEVTKLPLKSRDTFELLQLQPGVQSTLGSDFFLGSDQPGVVSVSGGRARSNNYTVNGGTAGDPMLNFPSLQPAPDSVSEFRVLSHNYNADLGHNSGSVLNVVTKSGNNKFHGGFYDFFRNDVFNARGYFDPIRADFKQNEFGSFWGGPIQRDKTFFYLSYEGLRRVQGISGDAVTVPTVQERAGDFSSGPSFAGILQSSTVAQALRNRPGCSAAVQAHGGTMPTAGSTYASIFPGNIIPGECFDATAVDLMNQFVPLGNVGTNIFHTVANALVRRDQATLRLDRNLTGQQQLSVYYYGTDIYDTEPFDRLFALEANLPGFGNLTRERFQQWNLSHLWTVSAKAVNEFRLIYYRNGQGELLTPVHRNLVQSSCVNLPSNQCFSDPANPRLGITPGYSPLEEGVPLVLLSGGFSFGNNPGGSFSQTGNTYQALDTYSKVIGTHTLKFGVDLRNLRLNQTYLYDVSGALQFQGGGPNDVEFSNLIPNYLLGLPEVFSEGSANGVDIRSIKIHTFVQDAWKLRPNLTLTYGLRWEFNPPQADDSRRVQTFRPGQATSIYPCVLSAANPLINTFGSADCSPTGPGRSTFPLGLVVPGDAGISDGLTNIDWLAFAPRFGLAWSPDSSNSWVKKLTGGPGRSSIRLGWGIFYDGQEELLFGENLAAQPPFGGTTRINNIFFNTPFLGQDGSITPNPFQGFLDPQPGTPVDFALFRPINLYGNLPPTLKNQYAAHYHLTMQRALGHDVILQFGYVGSQGHRLLATIDQNYGDARICLELNQIPGMSCGPFGADSTYIVPANSLPTGMTLHLPYGSASTITGPNSNPITLVGLRKYSSPFCEPLTGAGCPPDGIPVFASIFGTDPVASSSYNSLQSFLSKRFSHGLQFLISYTWSQSLDNASSFENSVNPLNPRLSRSLSFFDARHRFVVSEYWQIPSLWTNHGIGRISQGWGLSGILTLQSGFPIHLTSDDDIELQNSFNFESASGPDQIAPLRILHPQSSGGYFFSPLSFADPSLGHFGNAPRTICCGPGIANLDLGIHKTARLREGKTLEFRTEFFNIWNYTQFFNPDGNITDGDTFGQVRRARDPRLIQMALKLTF